MSVLVVGSVAFDAVKTPFGERTKALGGAATYFSLAASFFTKVKVIAVVGNDFTDNERSVFLDRDIDISEMQHVPDGKTFFWQGEYGYDMNTAHTLDTQLNVFGNFNPALSEAARHMPYVFLGNILPGLQRTVREQMTNPRLVALDTMNYWIENQRDSLLETLRGIDMLLINDAEARELGGSSNIIKAAHSILQMGPKTLIVKRGEYGAAMFRDGAYFAMPAYPCENVVDPTGAGDTFAGGFIGYLGATDNPDESAIRRAIIYGSVMASFTVEDFSCDRLRRLKPQEINQRFREFKKITHFEEIEFAHTVSA
jgi:sugar/nucleoside kinase (ribokinase family)